MSARLALELALGFMLVVTLFTNEGLLGDVGRLRAAIAECGCPALVWEDQLGQRPY